MMLRVHYTDRQTCMRLYGRADVKVSKWINEWRASRRHQIRSRVTENVGGAGAQRVRRTPAPVPLPSLFARARAHAAGAPDASSANQTWVSTPPRLRVPMLMFMLRRRQRRGVRVVRPPDARREGVRLSRCHGGASGGEGRGRSGRVQLDFSAGVVRRGYGHRHGVGLVPLRVRMRLLLVHSVEAPSG
ncbi:hypothetical protein B0H14DRAFT_493022 [Mycena olivaceomarginata]|nr:hypothetical protein B0H14DRAFT_493022 [Mycena olivaceomarginata]